MFGINMVNMGTSSRMETSGGLISTLRTLTNTGLKYKDDTMAGCPQYRCGGTGEAETPVYGRFGSYFNPSLKKSPVIRHQHQRKSGQEIEITSKVKNNELEQTYLRFPNAPPQYLGPYNSMWDPKVRRGSCLVHFHKLEKTCPVSVKRNRRPRNKNLLSKRNPMYMTKGTVIYPEVNIHTKQEITDYSLFLEEQNDHNAVTETAQVQTEDSIRLTCSEREERLAFKDSQRSDPKCHFKHKFQTGFDAETQVDYFHIATQMGNRLNPIQQTIQSVSSVLSKQLISQGILETMEISELGQIRAQVDAIELWIVQEQMQKAKMNRDLCKKLERMKMEAEYLSELESSFEDLRKRIAAGMMAIMLGKSITKGGFAQLERVGVLGANKEAEEIGAWVHNCVTNIVLKNQEVVRDVLDDLIDEANRERLLGQNFGIHSEADEVSDEAGNTIISKGDFGEDQEDDEDEEYESIYDNDSISVNDPAYDSIGKSSPH